MRIKNGLCWISLCHKGNKVFFPVFTPADWKLMLIQEGKSKIMYILE